MKKLSIPEHISLGKEYIPGIGGKELRQFLIAAVPGLAAIVIAWLILTDPGAKLLSMLLGIVYMTCCYVAFLKVDGTQSMYTFVARVIRFYRKQRNYYYTQGKEDIYLVTEQQQPGSDCPGIYQRGSH